MSYHLSMKHFDSNIVYSHDINVVIQFNYIIFDLNYAMENKEEVPTSGSTIKRKWKAILASIGTTCIDFKWS